VRRGFGEAQQFLERMRASQGAERVFVPEPWEIEAERLPAQYADQDFSYVDATSFVTMRHRGLKNAFAFDQHFVVAGFNLLGA
jgi:predicted nucleic acid-binding protein